MQNTTKITKKACSCARNCSNSKAGQEQMTHTGKTTETQPQTPREATGRTRTQTQTQKTTCTTKKTQR